MDTKTLSDKREASKSGYIFREKAVKEFIRLEFKLILMLNEGKITLDKFIEKRRELAGENLI